MKKLFLILLFLINSLNAKPYIPYEHEKMLTENSIKIDEIFKSVDNLWKHANSYPPFFDTNSDKNRAKKDSQTLLNVFDFLREKFYKTFDENLKKQFDFSQAQLFVIAYNLDVGNFAPQADEMFEKLIINDKNSALLHRIYGEFLGNSARNKKAEFHLKKAVELGDKSAHFGLGVTYLIDNNKTAAKDEFETFLKFYPNNEEAKNIIDAINKGNIEFKKE